MEPGKELFARRRRHNNTPKYVLLIIANYVVCCTLLTLDPKFNWFFFLTVGLLAIYNYFTIRRNIEEYTKPVVISYVVSIIVLIMLFILAHSQLV